MHCDPGGRGRNAAQSHLPLGLPEGVPPLNTFYLYLTTGCNLACRHCWITPTFADGDVSAGDCLDIGLLKEAVEEAKPLGLRHIKLTGGEPMLHPQFVQVVDQLTFDGLRLTMETNGTLIDADLAHHLKDETSLWFVSVSLDGACSETHDGFRNVPGAFDSALRGLSHLVDAGYRPQVIMSVHHGNIDQLDDVVRLAVDRGAGSVKFNPVMASGRGLAMQEQGETLSYDEIISLSHYVHGELQDHSPIPLHIMIPPSLLTLGELVSLSDSDGACGVRHILGILGGGEMALCGIGRTVPELCFGRLGQESVREVWTTHPMLLQLRRELADPQRYPGICGDCIHAPRCLTSCVAQNYLDFGHLVWPSSLCAEAERRGVFPSSRRSFSSESAR